MHRYVHIHVCIEEGKTRINAVHALYGACRRFSLHGSHLVDALRNFLESFRLPGESPIIARILETFSEHWLVTLLYIEDVLL